MKMNFVKRAGGVLAVLLCAALQLQAQQRFGGAGGGGGNFGGFGGLNGGGFNRGNSGTTSSGYNANGTVGNAVIQVDPVTHNLIVIADKQTSQQIRRVVESLDAPEPQVLIKVVFLEVQHNNAEELGVQGSFTGGNSISSLSGFVTNYVTKNIVSSVTSNGVTSTTTTPMTLQTVTPATQKTVSGGNSFGLPQSLAGATGNGGLYQVLGNDFTATIQAVATAGKSQVLSRPSILARDGQMATIEIGQNIYLPSGVTYTAIGTGGEAVPSINGTYTPVGIILNVTPFVGENGLVEMILAPQDSSVDTSSPGQVIAYGNSLIGSSPVYAPNINVTEANTVVVTPNGQTVVIGGLISNTKSSADSKVPFLGDIPLLGQLFRSSSTANSKTELLMFLTPHIVEAPSLLGGMSAGEWKQTQLFTNSVSEQELDRFLERVPVKKTKK